MREQHFGRIVNISSASGLYGNFGQANYSAAKMGIAGLTFTLSKEGAKRNILANVVAPLAASQMTDGIVDDELFELLKPEHVSPFVACVCAMMMRRSFCVQCIVLKALRMVFCVGTYATRAASEPGTCTKLVLVGSRKCGGSALVALSSRQTAWISTKLLLRSTRSRCVCVHFLTIAQLRHLKLPNTLKCSMFLLSFLRFPSVCCRTSTPSRKVTQTASRIPSSTSEACSSKETAHRKPDQLDCSSVAFDLHGIKALTAILAVRVLSSNQVQMSLF